MKPKIIAVLFAATLFGISRPTVWAIDEATPQWISAAELSIKDWQVSKVFTTNGPVQSARLKVAVDFARATIVLNGREVLQLEAYCPTQLLDVTEWMIAGENQIHVAVHGFPGPSALACELELQLTSGEVQREISNRHWTAVSRTGAVTTPCAEFGAVRPELWGAGRRDITLSAVENYEQWRQADGAPSGSSAPQFWTASGFQIAELRTATADEGSWISLTFDPEGRLIVSREDQGLLRMTLDAERSRVDRVESVDVELQECRGLVFHGPWLFANANNSHGLYRLQIDPQGQASMVTQVRGFPGGVGHGRNDLTISGDWLYEIHGDSVDLPTSNVVDLTSPARHWPGDVSQREGHLLRMHLDSGEWELQCAGLRNPYGVAANSAGDVFSFDADNEYDMGTPWYRPTRFVALLPGGDIGYRTANQQLPPRFHDQPENLLPVLTIGRSSPTAIFCDPQLQFPMPYRDAFYLLDWTYGRVIAVHLAARGASWRAQAELFLQGRPLNVTDVARGPDGALYLITGGRKTQSSLYRISATSNINGANAVNDDKKANVNRNDDANRTVADHEQASSVFSAMQVAKRKQLEAFSRARNPAGFDFAAECLADADPAIRHAARIVLERLPPDVGRARLLTLDDERTWIFGVLALAQSAEPAEVAQILPRWLTVESKGLNLSEAFAWVRIAELCLRADPDTTRQQAASLEAKLWQVWHRTDATQVAPEGTHVELRRRLALLLTSLGSVAATERIVSDLLPSTSQEDRIAGLLALRTQRQGWTNARRRQQLLALNETSQMVGGEGLPAFLKAIRDESLATFSASEHAELQAWITPAAEEIARELPTSAREIVQHWTLADLNDLAQSSQITGNRSAGRQLFQDGLCARCHRVSGLGESVGPDLTFVGRRFGPHDLLESILEPSRSVAENYRLDSVVTSAGLVHIGRVVVQGDYRSESLLLETNTLTGETVTVSKREIQEHHSIERSPMPEGLLDTLTFEQIRDLLAFLQDPGDVDSRATTVPGE